MRLKLNEYDNNLINNTSNFIIIIINSYILVTLIKLTHEKLYVIYIK